MMDKQLICTIGKWIFGIFFVGIVFGAIAFVGYVVLREVWTDFGGDWAMFSMFLFLCLLVFFITISFICVNDENDKRRDHA
tara:strand:+ start:512 stop:754 length:243 start_codon:yes stop_codon:yes gene_type:complete